MKIRYVLMVEDTESDVFFIKRALQKNGVSLENIHVSDNGALAIEYLQCVQSGVAPDLYPRPQIIFTDLKMPMVDGFDLLNWIRNNPAFATIPKIVLSSSSNDGDLRRAYSQGANSYIAKPSDADALVRTIEKTLEHWEDNNVLSGEQ